MSNVLFVLTFVFFLAATVVLAGAPRNSVQEIEGLIAFLITAVVFTGTGIIRAVDRLREELTAAGRARTRIVKTADREPLARRQGRQKKDFRCCDSRRDPVTQGGEKGDLSVALMSAQARRGSDGIRA